MRKLFNRNIINTRFITISSIMTMLMNEKRKKGTCHTIYSISKENLSSQISEGRSGKYLQDFTNILDYQDNESLSFIYNNLSKGNSYLDYLNEINKEGFYGKDYESLEENVVIGNADTIKNRSFAQFNASELFKNKNKDKEDAFDPASYFSKFLVFRIGDRFFATGSFCGYCFADLKHGAFIGDKITCSSCLSEYSITGDAESGPNSKYLSAFRVGLRGNNLVIRLPKGKLPLFRKPLEANFQSMIDPRHFVIIGETETTAAALNVFKQVFPGKLTIIKNSEDVGYLDYNKLHNSLFSINKKYATFLDEDYYNARNIDVFEEKVNAINLEKKKIRLSNGIIIPFDKVLIALGSERKKLGKYLSNCFVIDSIQSHAKVHNFLVNSDNSNLIVVGNSQKALNIACAARRVLDYYKRDSFQLGIVSHGKFFAENLANKEASKIIIDYLERNGITVFKDMDVAFEEKQEENKISKILLISSETGNLITLPVEGVVIEEGISISKCDFQSNIIPGKDKSANISYNELGVFEPTARYSLNLHSRYPNIFVAGSCANINSPLFSGNIRSDNVKTNYDEGLYAATNMLDSYTLGSYEFVPITSTQILDKKLSIIGNDKPSFDSKIVYIDKENEKFISYLILHNKVQGVVTYGFKNMDIYMKEALELDLMPEASYIISNLNTVHNKVVEKVIRNSDVVKTKMDKQISKLTNNQTIELSSYDPKDQFIVMDLKKRHDIGYNKRVKEIEEINHLNKQLEKQQEEQELKELKAKQEQKNN